jgi:hypothetical protein
MAERCKYKIYINDIIPYVSVYNFAKDKRVKQKRYVELAKHTLPSNGETTISSKPSE